jgi:single-strand DNA-binding protein
MSNIKFSGRIWKDPEMRFTKAGEPVLTWKMSLYTGKTKEGEYKKSAWIPVEIWGADAERLQNDIKEKMTITVEGVPREPRTYVKDGVEKNVGLEVRAFRVAIGDEFRDTPAEDSY